jgi:hypothetical protein
MTTLEVAHVARRRRASRTVSASDPHAQLIAAFNRLLGTPESTLMDAQDALGALVGALINAMSPDKPGVVPALTEPDLVRLVDRAASRLGCPPAPAPVSRLSRLAALFAFHPSRWVRHA